MRYLSTPHVYKEKAGLLDVVPPPQMGQIMLGLTTTLVGQVAPFAISFTTRPNPYYEQIENSMRLRISVENWGPLTIYTADAKPVLLMQDSGSDEMYERRQSLCGRIVREAWSNDTSYFDHANAYSAEMDHTRETRSGSFPVPNGCYYTLENGMFELYFVFEPRN